MGNYDEIVNDIKDLQELKRMRDELDAVIEAASDKVKAELGKTETGTFGEYKVTFREVTSHPLDTKALRRDLPEIADRYSKTVVTRPLKIT